MNKTASRKVLGRGLSSVISGASRAGGIRGRGTADASPQCGILNLPVDKILPNEQQPRRRFDEEKLSELTASIRERGVLQPVIVSRVNGSYQLVVGERRWRAAQAAGLADIPALVREFTGADGLEVALIENLQREDLNPIEEAAAYQFLMREHAMKQEDVATRVGRSRSAIANAVRLLNLPPAILEDLESGVISAGHARAFLPLNGANQQMRVWTRVKKHHLSVRQTEAYVRGLLETATPRDGKKRRHLSPEWVDVQENLQRHLSAQVRIRPRSREAGKIEIHYASSDDLDRLVYALLRRGNGYLQRKPIDDDLL